MYLFYVLSLHLFVDYMTLWNRNSIIVIWLHSFYFNYCFRKSMDFICTYHLKALEAFKEDVKPIIEY